MRQKPADHRVLTKQEILRMLLPYGGLFFGMLFRLAGGERFVRTVW